MSDLYIHENRLHLPSRLWGREDEGVAPAGMFQVGDIPAMVPGRRGLTADGQDVNTLWQEAQQRITALNSQVDAWTALLTFPVVGQTEKVGTPTNPRFQEATEYGRPTKTRVKLIERAFPLDHHDLAMGYTQEFIDESTGAQVRAVMDEVEGAWVRLRRNVILEALMTEDNRTQEALTVRRLYNGDGEVPPPFKRWTFDGNHTHYLADNGGALTAALLNTMEEHLVHHGFGSNEAPGDSFYLFVNRAEMATLRALDQWIPSQSSIYPEIVNGDVYGQRAAGSGMLDVQGYVNRWAIVENNDIPADYALGLVTGGLFSLRNPIGLRAHSNPSARGLRLQGPETEYPLINSVYDGYIGAGVRQRGAAVSLYIGGASYVSPSFDDLI